MLIIPKVSIKDTDVANIKEVEVSLTSIKARGKMVKQDSQVLECKLRIDNSKDAFKSLTVRPDGTFSERITEDTLNCIKDNGALHVVLEGSSLEFNLKDAL